MSCGRPELPGTTECIYWYNEIWKYPSELGIIFFINLILFLFLLWDIKRKRKELEKERFVIILIISIIIFIIIQLIHFIVFGRFIQPAM
jgi:hypothetical protein